MLHISPISLAGCACAARGTARSEAQMLLAETEPRRPRRGGGRRESLAPPIAPPSRSAAAPRTLARTRRPRAKTFAHRSWRRLASLPPPSCCRGVGRALDSCDAGGSSATSETEGRGDGDGGAASGTDSTDGRRDEATDGGRDSGGASSDEKRTAEVARETRAADGGTPLWRRGLLALREDVRQARGRGGDARRVSSQFRD